MIPMALFRTTSLHADTRATDSMLCRLSAATASVSNCAMLELQKDRQHLLGIAIATARIQVDGAAHEVDKLGMNATSNGHSGQCPDRSRQMISPMENTSERNDGLPIACSGAI